MDSLRPDYSFPEDLRKEYKKKSYIKKISQIIIYNLREGKSQEFMNLRLGFKFNQYAKWEKGNKTILWKDFLEICEIRKVKLTPALSRRFSFRPSELDISDVHIINFYMKTFFHSKISLMAKYLEVTPAVLRRMISAKVDVSLNVVLKLFLYRPIFFLYFLNDINIIQKIPELKKEFEKLASYEQLEASSPFVSAVLYYFSTSEYILEKKHSSKFLAQKTGLTISQVDYAIAELKNRQLITEVNGKYIKNQIASELHTLTVEQIVKILSYWNYRTVSYLKRKVANTVQPKTRNHTSFRVFSATKSTSDKIAEKLAQTYYEINQLIKEDCGSEKEEIVLKVLSMNYFGIEESQPVDLVSDKNMGLIEL